MQAYSDGVNDFVASIGAKDSHTARVLPPEFLLIGLKEF